MRYPPIVGTILVCLACLFTLTGKLAHAQSVRPTVVISQIYGGGGNSGATYTHDFIELFNRGDAPVSLEGWSVQYASANGTNWQKTELTGTLQPGRYYLIQQAQGSRGTTPLPAPDAIGYIFMSANSGKVALLSTSDLLPRGTICPAGDGLMNLVSFGRTNCSGGSAAPALDSQSAALRLADGCALTDDGGDDFVADEPKPRNSASQQTDCSGGSVIRSLPISTVTPISTTTLPFTSQRAITPTQSLNISQTATTLPSASSPLPASQPLLISQIYGGGGNAGATYTHDFIELHNPGPTTVDVSGWSVQYASATGKSWLVTPLNGTISAGEWYLIQQAEGAGGSVSLSRPDVIGETAMSASSGKVALVRNVEPLTGPCPDAETIVDFVGYGDANCFEGSAPGPKISNTDALHRQGEEALDSDDNLADFSTSPPTPRGAD